MAAAAAITLTAFGATGTIAPARAATATQRAVVTNGYLVRGQLIGVAALSPANAWAVGFTGNFDTSPKILIVHWNGKKWLPVASPAPIPGALWGIAAASPKDIWAVGETPTGVLVMHYNGTRWSRDTTVPRVVGQLTAVAVSGGTVWATGGLNSPPLLAMRHTAAGWKVLKTPLLDGSLLGVAVSGGTVWADGTTSTTTSPNVGDALVRWNGSRFVQAPFPLHGTGNNLWGIAAGPKGLLFSVGFHHNASFSAYAPLSMEFRGGAWHKVGVPAPANSVLYGVGFVPEGTAWAFGSSGGFRSTLILGWTGLAWSRVASPSPFGGSNVVSAMAATSPKDMWLVGGGTKSPASSATYTLIMHWNGTNWT
jgi:hypothetical protein